MIRATVGLELNRAVVVIERRFPVALGNIGLSPLGVADAAFRIEADRLVVIDNGLVLISLESMNPRAICIAVGHISLYGNRRIIVRQGALKISSIQVGSPALP